MQLEPCNTGACWALPVSMGQVLLPSLHKDGSVAPRGSTLPRRKSGEGLSVCWGSRVEFLPNLHMLGLHP